VLAWRGLFLYLTLASLLSSPALSLGAALDHKSLWTPARGLLCFCGAFNFHSLSRTPSAFDLSGSNKASDLTLGEKNSPAEFARYDQPELDMAIQRRERGAEPLESFALVK
jgi:hypothetical protein